MPIEVRNVSLIYNEGTPFETKALDNVSFKIEDGEFVGIMGHTGCGKSTMMQLIDGLIEPSAGEIIIDGKIISDPGYDRGELRRNVGMVFQYPECQLFETTVEKDVAFGLKHSGLPAEEIADRVKWSLEILGFEYERIRKKSPLGFSGGEKRRIAIAGILAAKPKALLLDEPIAGLDPLGRADFLTLLQTLNEQGTTIVMISHNADCIGQCAKRVIVFEQGRTVLDGTTAEVFSDTEKMKSLHLSVGQSRELANLLAENGLPMPDGLTKYDELRSAVICCFGKETAQ